MTPIKQTRFGDEGNCFWAAVASILELPLEVCDMGVFATCQEQLKALDELLSQMGLAYIEALPEKTPIIGADGLYFLAHGPSLRGRSHTVVMRIENDHWKKIHDPHPDNSFITEIEWIGFIITKTPSALSQTIRKSFAPGWKFVPSLDNPATGNAEPEYWVHKDTGEVVYEKPLNSQPSTINPL